MYLSKDVFIDLIPNPTANLFCNKEELHYV